MSNNKSVKLETEERFPWLFQELGFQTTHDTFDPTAFGNSTVTMTSPDFLVRFVRDRGQYAIEVAPHSDPDDWLDMEDIREVVAGHELERSFDLKTLASRLREDYATLSDLLNTNLRDIKKKLHLLYEKRDRDMLKGF